MDPVDGQVDDDPRLLKQRAELVQYRLQRIAAQHPGHQIRVNLDRVLHALGGGPFRLQALGLFDRDRGQIGHGVEKGLLGVADLEALDRGHREQQVLAVVILDAERHDHDSVIAPPARVVAVAGIAVLLLGVGDDQLAAALDDLDRRTGRQIPVGRQVGAGGDEGVEALDLAGHAGIQVDAHDAAHGPDRVAAEAMDDMVQNGVQIAARVDQPRDLPDVLQAIGVMLVQ